MQQERLVILGDTTYNDSELRMRCAQRGPYPHPDDGVEVRRLFHQVYSHTIENFNGPFKSLFNCSRSVPTKGLLATQRFVLGAVLVYQLAVWHRFRTRGRLRADLKPLLQAA